MKGYFTDDIICALATPQGRGGISVIRLSGKNSSNLVRKLCPNLAVELESHRIYFTNLRNHDDGQIIDEVLLSFFKEGKSFTGEESIEISCHGSPVVVDQILQNLIKAGARAANRGEFTYRAFMNQRIDLTQAESVLSLIESQSKQAANLSLRQLKGELSKELKDLEDKITFVLANLEASIDFSTEDIDVLEYEKCESYLKEVFAKTTKILSSYNKGRLINQGYQIGIVGKPNAGKSSLLNALVAEDRAIVSDQPGTTRDVVEAQMSVNGIVVTFSDTAGIHQTKDRIEKLGIERSIKKMQDADHLFVVIDPNDMGSQQDFNTYLKDRRFSVLFSKADLPGPVQIQLDGLKPFRQISYSALSGEGLDQIAKLIEDLLKESFVEDSAVIFQTRHFELFTKIKESVQRALDLFINRASQEFIALELQEAIYSLHEILGKRFDDEVMDRVFKEFCIGK